MSADRFEISDHGSKLTVRDTKYGSEVSMLRVRSYSRELTVMAGAIRQQARDITELKVEARTLGYRAKTLDMLALRILGDEESEDFVKDELDHLQQPSDWLPFESPAYVVAQCIDERDQLRTDLAAAVAERDRLTRSIEDDFSGWRAVERRWKLRAEQAESRLAAIEAAPTVAWQWMDTGHFRKNKPDGALVFDWRPLIARPAKD